MASSKPTCKLLRASVWLCSIVTRSTEGLFYSVGEFVFLKILLPTISLTLSKTDRLSWPCCKTANLERKQYPESHVKIDVLQPWPSNQLRRIVIISFLVLRDQRGTPETSKKDRLMSQAGWGRVPRKWHHRCQATASTQRLGLGDNISPYLVSSVSTQTANTRRGPQQSKDSCDAAFCLQFYFVILLLLSAS